MNDPELWEVTRTSKKEFKSELETRKEEEKWKQNLWFSKGNF